MHSRREVPKPLQTLALLQDGAVSREQALGHGLSDHVLSRLVRSGSWQSLGAGVYATGSQPPTWPTLAWAGVLLGGPAARLGAEASGHLHDLQSAPPTPVDVLVPRTGRFRTAGPWRFVRESPGVRSPRSTGSPPRLLIEEAVLDLAAAVDQGEVVRLVTRAVQLRRTRATRIALALAERPRHPHRAFLRQLLGDVADGAESSLELTYLRDVERAHGLPKGVRQASRRGLPYRSDVGYDEWSLLVELDGRLGHEGEGRFRDMWRDNQFSLGDLLTLRYGWIDVTERPCLVAVQVGAALYWRGWDGMLRRCPRCRHAPDADLWSP